ncbi:MAG: acyl-CoA thioesterase [Omnitrophica WOR_2 bacterium]
MAFTFKETYSVRYYECDRYEHVNNAVYLRYLQETSLRAFAAAGYGVHRHQSQGKQWWAEKIDFEYLSPLRYADTFELYAYPLGMASTHILFGYEFRRPVTGELAARARALYEFQDIDTCKPALIPLDLHNFYFPDGNSQPEAVRLEFPPAPPAPVGVFRSHSSVAWQDINANLQVDPATILAYVEECGMQVIAAHRWPLERMLSDGFTILLRRNQIHSIRTARLGDELEFATWASDVKRATATRHYQVTRLEDGALIAQVHSLGVWINLETGLPMRVPALFLKDFDPNIV